MTDALKQAAHIDYSVVHEFAGKHRLNYDELCVMVRAALSAPQPAAPQVGPVDLERHLDEVMAERDAASDYIDALLDEVLGADGPEWSSAYGHADAMSDVRERMTALHKPSVDKAWKQFEEAAAPQPAPAPAQAVPLTDEVHVAAELAIAEVRKATAKFPTWPTDPLHALAVLGEEFGELTKDVLQLVYEPHKTSHENVRTEAIQTAAMGLRFLMSLDSYTYAKCNQHAQVLAHGIKQPGSEAS